MLHKTMIVLAIICTPLLFAPTSEAAIPPPPIPYTSSQPLSPSGFFIAEQVYQQDWTRGTFYLLTILNGTSGSFDIEIKPSDPCKNGCRGWEFPLNMELRLSLGTVDVVITDWGGKHRQLSGGNSRPGDSDGGVEDISVTISPNPIVLKLGDTVKVKITITAKPSAGYGIYDVRLATRVGEGSISSGLLLLKTSNVRLGLETKYYNAMGLLKDYPPEPLRRLYASFPNITISQRFSNNSWFVLEPNATLKASYDGQNYQRGWWDIKKDQIFFILPEGTFTGRMARGTSIILYDNSVWLWSGLTGGPPISRDELPAHPPIPIVEGWSYGSPFSPAGFCSVGKGWVGHYANAATYTLVSGRSASLRFTITPRFAIPPMNLSLGAGILENETVQGFLIEKIRGISITFTPNPVKLEPGEPLNVTVTFTVDSDAPESLHGLQFTVKGEPPLTSQGAVVPYREGYRPPYGAAGQLVLFFLKVQSECPDTIKQVVTEDHLDSKRLPALKTTRLVDSFTDYFTALVVAAVGLVLMLGVGIFYVRRRKPKTVGSFS